MAIPWGHGTAHGTYMVTPGNDSTAMALPWRMMAYTLQMVELQKDETEAVRGIAEEKRRSYRGWGQQGSPN